MQINFFGHCNEGSHDKVWGFVTGSDGTLYNFWGKRGGTFAFQQHPATDWQDANYLHKKSREKCREGRRSGTYSSIPVAEIETVWPGFHDEFDIQIVMAKLGENFR